MSLSNAAPIPDRPLRRHAMRGAALVGGALAAFCGLFYGFASEPRHELGLVAELLNVREVDPGRFYRSAQLSAATLREVADAFDIRTVVSLRGYDNRGADWHRDELAVTRELGIAHFDVHLSAGALPRKVEVLRLLQIYRDAPRPLLVHCLGGADRSGEASALWLIEQMGRTPQQALAMLTARFRHFEWLRPAKRAFVRAYRGERWLREDYDPCAAEWGDLERPGSCDEPKQTARR